MKSNNRLLLTEKVKMRVVHLKIVMKMVILRHHKNMNRQERKLRSLKRILEIFSDYWNAEEEELSDMEYQSDTD